MRSHSAGEIIAAILFLGLSYAGDLFGWWQSETSKTGTGMQDTGQISGRLQSGDTGEPMPFVEIMLFDHFGLSSVRRTDTDIDGRYAFAGLVLKPA